MCRWPSGRPMRWAPRLFLAETSNRALGTRDLSLALGLAKDSPSMFAPRNLQHCQAAMWPRHGHPPKGHRPVLKNQRETFSHISPDVCTTCVRHTAGVFSETISELWRTGCTPCPRVPNGRPPQPKNAGCAAKGSSFGGGVNAIGFLMVNIGLLDYPLHGGRETRELGPKK